jgi:hypothetical protein
VDIALPRPNLLIKEARERQRRRRMVVTLALAVLAMAAYGIATREGPVASTGVVSTTPPLPNPCALLSNADVGKVFGAEIAYRSPKPERRACSWSGWPFPGRPGQQTVTIDVAQATRAQFERAYSTWVIIGEGPRRIAHSRRIDGFGEAAFAQSYAQSFAGVDLETYYHGFVISIGTTFVGSELAAEKQLTTAAIARLRAREAAA